jgi:hypothetical protein
MQAYIEAGQDDVYIANMSAHYQQMRSSVGTYFTPFRMLG